MATHTHGAQVSRRLRSALFWAHSTTKKEDLLQVISGGKQTRLHRHKSPFRVTVFDTFPRHLCLFWTALPQTAGVIPRLHKARREGSCFAEGCECKKKGPFVPGTHDVPNFPAIWLCGWLFIRCGQPCFIKCFCSNLRFNQNKTRQWRHCSKYRQDADIFYELTKKRLIYNYIYIYLYNMQCHNNMELPWLTPASKNEGSVFEISPHWALFDYLWGVEANSWIFHTTTLVLKSRVHQSTIQSAGFQQPWQQICLDQSD